MTDQEALILLARHRSIDGAVALAEALWPGSHHHRKTNGAALARAAGAIMKRLEKEGLVEIVPGAWRKRYRINEKGLKRVGAGGVLPEKHFKGVSVQLCSRAACNGDEEGCNSAECGGDAGWKRFSHEKFLEWFLRCPKQCQTGRRSTQSDCSWMRRQLKLRKVACCKTCHEEREGGLWMCLLALPEESPPSELCCSLAKALTVAKKISSLHTEVIFDQHHREASGGMTSE